jgi:REP element-mobilizing transposase RayT
VKRFPRRPPRIELFQGIRPFYFITFNTHLRRKVLANRAVHAAFRTFAERAHQEHMVAVGRYVLMPDHVHLFVALPEDVRLAPWIKSLKAVLGKALASEGVERPHWQQGFFDHVLRGSESYSEKWDYVRQNPVRAGLVDDGDSWLFQGEIVRLPFD